MENENLKPIEKLTPFTKMIMTIGTLPSSFYASMSYYESMVWLYEYLKNQVIPTVNNNAEAVEELQTAFTTLETFINEYFENLDVQEEINNKLDEMAEDGSLTNLIKDYVDPIYQDYETSINEEVADFKLSVNNSIASQNDEISNFKSTVNNRLSAQDLLIDDLQSGSPLVASSTSEMTDTTRVYVNTTDGKWYYYDGDSWEIGGTYQSAEDSNTVNDLKIQKVSKYPKYNLNNSNYTVGIIQSDGTISSYADYKTTDYIQVFANEAVFIRPSCSAILAFDVDKEIVAGSYDNTFASNKVFTPTADGYIRVSFLASIESTFGIFKNSDKIVNFSYIKQIEDNVLINDNNINQVNEKYYLDYILNNGYLNFTEQPLTFTDGGYISPVGTVTEYVAGHYATVSITNDDIGKVYKISGTSDANARLYVFKSTNNIIEYPYKTNTTATEELIFIPKETGTLYINKLSSNETRLFILNKVMFNKLYGKKYCACGDSFTAGDFQYSNEDYQFHEGLYKNKNKVYPYIIGKRNNMTIVNLSLGGTTISSIGVNSFTNSEKYKDIPADSDYITLKFGINDESLGCPIGTINDETADTYYGAWNVVMGYITENYKNAKVGIIVSNAINSLSYINATIDIAKKYGVAYLDEATDEKLPFLDRAYRGNMASSVKDIKNAYLQVAPNTSYPSNNNFHPNVKCHMIESDIVEEWLKSI